MAMGKRKRDRQPQMWVAVTDLPTAVSHPFYRRLNQLRREHGSDDFTEAQCASFYAGTMGRPGVPPGVYFRLLFYESATVSSAARSATRNPSFSVRTKFSLFQRLMMRMVVSIVVPIMSASS